MACRLRKMELYKFPSSYWIIDSTEIAAVSERRIPPFKPVMIKLFSSANATSVFVKPPGGPIITDISLNDRKFFIVLLKLFSLQSSDRRRFGFLEFSSSMALLKSFGLSMEGMKLRLD